MEQTNPFSNFKIVGDYMNRYLDQHKNLLGLDATVLITGSTGTGKELVARWIHFQDHNRRNKPFVKISIPNINESIFESEVFGYERGAFTGAIAGKKGLVEISENGTLFLDEIENASPSIQSKLLQLLEDRVYRKVGGTEYHLTNARFIIASNMDLRNEVEQGRFRSDLYFRLAVLELHLPRLVERDEDILTLTNYFITELNQKLCTSIQPLHRRHLSDLLAYHWPGNVRELKNFIEKSMVFATDQVIDLEPLREKNSGSTLSSSPLYREHMKEKEKEFFHAAYKAAEGKIERIASIIGMSVPFVYKKIKEHGIKKYPAE